MPPPLAAVLCLLFVAYLFRRESRENPADGVSWAPFAWIFLAGSRYVSTWLSLRGPGLSVDGYAEGSPIDRTVFFALIVWGLVVLHRRPIQWSELFAGNKILVFYFLFCILSVLWSDEPFILVKRWIKDLGNPVMALVMLTEKRPYAAIGATIRRFSYLCIPVSVLFVRYYPEMGRGYKATGAPMYTGIGQQKNSLGTICLIVGLYLSWRWLCRDTDRPSWRPGYPDLILMVMVAWLLRMSDSQTATICLGLGIAVLLTAKLPWVVPQPSRALPTILASGAGLFVVEKLFHVKDRILVLIGRDPSLTNRDTLWEVVLAQQASEWVGAGFMSFWSGNRMAAIWREVGVGVNQAHNGYIEQYLNLGYLGVAFILLIVASALWSVRSSLIRGDTANAMFRLAVISCVLVSNYTEASFYGVSVMWTLFLAAAIEPMGAYGDAPKTGGPHVTSRRPARQRAHPSPRSWGQRMAAQPTLATPHAS